ILVHRGQDSFRLVVRHHVGNGIKHIRSAVGGDGRENFLLPVSPGKYLQVDFYPGMFFLEFGDDFFPKFIFLVVQFLPAEEGMGPDFSSVCPESEEDGEHPENRVSNMANIIKTIARLPPNIILFPLDSKWFRFGGPISAPARLRMDRKF